MLPKKYRITHNQFWNNPHRQIRFQTRFFTAFTKPSEVGNLRFCIQAGKTVDKRATERNRLKRMVTEELRPNLNKTIAKDVVIKVIKKIEDVQRPQLVEDIAGLIRYLLKI